MTWVRRCPVSCTRSTQKFCGNENNIKNKSMKRTNGVLAAYDAFLLRELQVAFGCAAVVYTVEPHLADTPEKQTPRLYGHFLKSQRLALFYLYKLPLEMRTPRYSVLWTAPCAPPYATLYKLCPIIRTFQSAARKWPLPDLHRYL